MSSPNCCRAAWSVLLAAIYLALPGSQAMAQSGLRESLQKLDRNRDGRISPHEITSLSRPLLERIYREGRMSMDQDQRIEEILRAADRYYAQQRDNARRSLDTQDVNTIKSFGADRDEPVVPEFGLTEIKYPYTQADLESADRMLRSYDRNNDGFIDRSELDLDRWSRDGNPFEFDFNGDGRLSRLELAQRYAYRRLTEGVSDELQRKAIAAREEYRASSSARSSSDSSRTDSQWWRRGGNSYWLTASIMERFDINRNGRLEAHETKDLGLPVGQMDLNLDGEISREELYSYLSQLQEETGPETEGIPGWFYELDTDRDRQVSMSEFTSDWTPEKMAEFAALDLNGDGFITAAEVARSKQMMGGSYTNSTAEVLPPRRTVISEIEIDEDFIIAELKLELSITHTYVGQLDAFLTGPDGQRVELFTEIGGSDDHFDRTIFDDKADTPIVKARAPFRGSFHPKAVTKREPSLSSFRGKSVKGVWQLVVRGTRSDRFGMLHNWTLMIRPEEQLPGQTRSSDPDQEQAREPAQAQASSSQPFANPTTSASVSPASGDSTAGRSSYNGSDRREGFSYGRSRDINSRPSR